jgi:hypothetical protein
MATSKKGGRSNSGQAAAAMNSTDENSQLDLEQAIAAAAAAGAEGNGLDRDTPQSPSPSLAPAAETAIPPNPFDDPAILQYRDDGVPSESPFDDLERLKRDWQYADDNDEDDEQAEDVLTTMPVRRPGKKWFAVHPSDEYLHYGCILEEPASGLHYYVMPAVADLMTKDDEARRVVLVLCVNRLNVLFLWPFSRQNTWLSSGLAAVRAGRMLWIKAIGDTKLGGYRLKASKAGVSLPQWDILVPQPMSELLKLAFGDRVIASTTHPLLKDV